MEASNKQTSAPNTSALTGVLPKIFRVVDFTKARGDEVLHFKNAVSTLVGSKRTFQTLPRHLRRRAMSHKPWKIPRRIRHIARREMEGAEKKKKTRTFRRHKRRPRYALQDYARRQQKFKWLETHIWHAKRMHMIDIWGFKIANYPNDKGVKATFRMARNKCTIHDMSYYYCIELAGPQSSIISLFKQITHCGSVANELYLPGCREGHTLLYHPNQYPMGCIGPVSFFWNPEHKKSEADPSRQIWVWIHPSIHSTVSSLISSLQQQYMNVGPTSHEVIKTSLKPTKQPNSNNNQNNISSEQFWNTHLMTISNVASLPHGMIVNLPMQDPVEVFPPTKVATVLKKKTEPLNVNNSNVLFNENVTDEVLSSVSASPLWRSEWRASLTSERKFPNEIAKPSKAAKKAKPSPDVPKQILNILLIQHPGTEGHGLGSGWDVIAPSGWAMPLWMNFVYAGARPVGQRDICHLDYELAAPSFPIDYPDTVAHVELAKTLSESRKQEYEKRPPGKRPNYKKLRTKFPFGPDWNDLLSLPQPSQDNSVTSTSFCVLRGDLLNEFCTKLYPEDAALASYSQLKWVPKPQGSYLDKFKGSQVYSVLKNSLVQVTVTMMHGGVCPSNSMLCLPLLEDYQKLKKAGENWSLQEPIFAPKIENKLRKNNLISDPIRLVAGYLTSGVTSGGYSYMRGQSFGIGFMSSEKLAQLFHEAKNAQSDPLVLVRSPSSPHYRFAFVSLCDLT